MVLTKMRQIAESYLGKEVKNAVLTVPAYLTMLSVRQRRMLERLRDWMWCVSSTSLWLQPSPTVWTRREERRTSWSSIWAVAPSMWQCWPSITVFCRVCEDKKIRKNMDHNHWRGGNYKQDIGEIKRDWRHHRAMTTRVGASELEESWSEYKSDHVAGGEVLEMMSCEVFDWTRITTSYAFLLLQQQQIMIHTTITQITIAPMTYANTDTTFTGGR